MSESIKNHFTKIVNSIIESNVTGDEYKLFVFLGITDYIDIKAFEDHIIDCDTFFLNGNASIFTKEWCKKMNRKIVVEENGYGIMSYQQFCYYEGKIGEDDCNNIVIIQDNLRSIFPLKETEYISVVSDENNSHGRPDELPIFEADQIEIKGKYFYSVKRPVQSWYTVNLFGKQTPLSHDDKQKDVTVIDFQNDSYDIDIFINECIENDCFNRVVGVKSYKKHSLNLNKKKLELINTLLNMFGGTLVEIDEENISDTYCQREESNTLLHKYWGENATFRNIPIYENPDTIHENPDTRYEIIDISQKQIVDTIINEYENSKNGNDVRDLFLTASTGAGKSLLFQIPAFYIAGQGGVTIVVSPLKALMYDQVESIRGRGFNNVEFLNSDISLNDRTRIIEECKNGVVDILYMTPELLLSYDISFFIGYRKLGLIVVDEAHIVTTWGRGFRIDYWHLGDHIEKMRKKLNYIFPIIAVTATAVYGGENDMVFDIINSLKMKQPHIFIGDVKRNDITFVVNAPIRSSNSRKAIQTAKFITSMVQRNIKTIVYVPYPRHINDIIGHINMNERNSITQYHGRMKSGDKDRAMCDFRNNNKTVMICTNAFGMGVDIPDVQVVYHHAPSGIFPDYIQEIGRAARDSSLNGFAALDYAPIDLHYSKTLYALSAIKPWQLKAVLKKIIDIYKVNNRNRNILVSTDDFKYIFPTDDTDQKVQSAFMMIEQDYLAKAGFPVLIARPQKSFAQVYAKTDVDGYRFLNTNYPHAIEVIKNANDIYTVKLKLDEIWKTSFSDENFSQTKGKFYTYNLFPNINLCPLKEFTFNLKVSRIMARDIFNKLVVTLIEIFEQYGTRIKFTENDMLNKLYNYFADMSLCQRIVSFILDTYYIRNNNDNNKFLQKHIDNSNCTYEIHNIQFCEHCLMRLINMFSDLFYNNRYLPVTMYCGSRDAENYVRIGCLMDLLGIGTYGCSGGNNPVVFVRINDPKRIERDSENSAYKNTILEKTRQKHDTSMEIFNHFFTNDFDNDTRWYYIEDFFLGRECDYLKRTYTTKNRATASIVNTINNEIAANDAHDDLAQ